MKENKDSTYYLHKGKRGLLQLIFSRLGIAVIILLLQVLLLFSLFEYVSTNYVQFFYGGAIVITFFGYLYLINSRSDGSVKLTWMVLFTILPIIGIFLYFYMQMEIGHRLEKRRLIRIKSESKQLIATDIELKARLKEERDLLGIANFLTKSGSYPIYEQADLVYYPSGEAKYQELLEELKQAKSFIFLEYFIVSEGKMWRSILDILIEKAQAGVEVRFLYDGFNEFSQFSPSYPKQLERLGIKTKIFARIRPFVSTTYNFRDHRKICVIDGKTAFTGGVNLADEYINEIERFGYWKDTAIKVKGKAVDSFTIMFLQMWAMDDGVTDFSNWINHEQETHEAAGYVIPYGDDPLDNDRAGEFIYFDILNKATEYVHIMTPYLILDSEMETALCLAARRGVEVQIILPHIPDKKMAFALAKTHYKVLLDAGVQIYEFTPGFIHAKVFVSDNRKGTVGTINLDYRSFYHHFECGLYMEKTAVLADIEKDFQETLKKSQVVTLADAKKEHWWVKITGWLLKAFAPLM